MSQTNIKGKVSKFLYKLLVDESFITPNVEEYWNLFFGADIKWTMIWKEKISNLKELCLAQFNYKLLYKLHMSKEYLCRWKLIDSPSCNRCQCLENYYHLFYECPFSEKFWKKFGHYCFKIKLLQIDRKVEYEDIIIGTDDESTSKVFSFHNMLISLGAFTLFREKRKLNFDFIFESFVEEVKWRSKTRKEPLWKVYRDNID